MKKVLMPADSQIKTFVTFVALCESVAHAQFDSPGASVS
jgi:hypothetical protein